MVTKVDSRLGREINLAFGINIYTLLDIKIGEQQDLLYFTENYTQYLLITYNGKESEKEYKCVTNHFAVHLK